MRVIEDCTELKYKSLYEDQEFDIYLIKFVQCMYNLPNKDFWTLNGVIFSHLGVFKRDLRSFERIWKFSA